MLQQGHCKIRNATFARCYAHVTTDGRSCVLLAADYVFGVMLP